MCRLNSCRIAASFLPGFTGSSPTRAAHSPLGMHIYPYYKKYTPQIISEIYYLRKQKDSPILDFPQLLTFFSIFTRTSTNLCFPRANGSLVSQTVFCYGPAAFYLLPANDRSFATNRGHFAAAVAISPIAPRFLSRTRRVSCHTFLLLVFCFPRPPCHALFFPFCGVPSPFCSLPVAGFLPRFAFLKRPLLVLSSVGQRPPFVVPQPFAVFLPSSARLRRARSSFSFAADMPSFARQSRGRKKYLFCAMIFSPDFYSGKTSGQAQTEVAFSSFFLPIPSRSTRGRRSFVTIRGSSPVTLFRPQDLGSARRPRSRKIGPPHSDFGHSSVAPRPENRRTILPDRIRPKTDPASANGTDNPHPTRTADTPTLQTAFDHSFFAFIRSKRPPHRLVFTAAAAVSYFGRRTRSAEASSPAKRSLSVPNPSVPFRRTHTAGEQPSKNVFLLLNRRDPTIGTRSRVTPSFALRL